MNEVRRAYAAMADQYVELIDAVGVHADDLAMIERHLTTRPGTVLDAGCGPGHLTAHLRSLGVEAIGIDIVPEFIEHARATHPTGRYELGSIRGFDAPDGSVAGVLAWYSLIHLSPDEIGAALIEIRRVLVPGGRLVAGFFDGNAVEPFDHKVTTAYFWPVDEFCTQLRHAGFTPIERARRAGRPEPGHRPHAAVAARAA